MADPHIRKLAQVLTHYGAQIESGDLVSIRSEIVGAPLVREIYREVVSVGGFPVCRLSLPDEKELFLREAPEDLLEHCPQFLLREISAFDARISIMAHENTQRLAGVDPKREAKHRQAFQPITEAFWKRINPASERPLKWTLGLFPTNAFAQDARMSLQDFQKFVWRSCFLDKEDPVAEWTALGKEQQLLIDRVSSGSELHIKADGTDLTMRYEGRTWVNDDGQKNLPGGEFFTSPIEDSVNGRVQFDPPACIFGRRVEGVRLEFEDGKVVDADARHEADFLQHMLRLDDGASYLGEIAFGNNPNVDQFTGNVLFDEKVAGTVHMALGASIPQCGGKNKSALHWDMVCDLREGGEVYIDGELFQRDGNFV